MIMPVHEFGIIDNIENVKKNIGYEPQKYNCISVDDEIIIHLNEHLSILRTYFHSLERPEFGLAYWGITIIPPESLSMFYDVITSSTIYKNSAELNRLASKIIKAKEENKYMIHFGI
ncbi:short-chain dehydrogenase [Bacillus sp. ISL-40]|uniref:short-chain dehydrogenase n=1 Tax=Bacillus sp. ISL-40 TaxID=2819126 RepID=UPI001BEA1CD8|nr:short-chain dehydrogenase [Bacillus sp. ISL-40]MBT2696544.1 short-chain dehydrogenase [Bacillus sp. ISL-40]